MADLERALGQFMLYDTLLEDAEPERLLYLAIDVPTYEQAFSEQSGEKLRRRNNLRLIIYDAGGETIRQWIL